MAYKGVVKGMGKDYGFIECPEVYANYQRDVFINKVLVGDDVYWFINKGDTVSFDVTEDQKGQPQAVNLVQLVNAKTGQPPVPKGKGPSEELANAGKGKSAKFSNVFVARSF